MSDIDPEKLERAIEIASEEIFGRGRLPGKGARIDANSLNLLMEAAKVTLATLPKTKEVEVWRVEFVMRTGPEEWEPLTHTYKTRALADHSARDKESEPAIFSCIRVTGPHKQRVPA